MHEAWYGFAEICINAKSYDVVKNSKLSSSSIVIVFKNAGSHSLYIFCYITVLLLHYGSFATVPLNQL